eukprot:COSAG01_NODE_12165_length_1788_cov_123.984606_3_plen_179_part_00
MALTLQQVSAVAAACNIGQQRASTLLEQAGGDAQLAVHRSRLRDTQILTTGTLWIDGDLPSSADADVGTGAGGDNAIAKMSNRREISVSSYYDQSHYPPPYLLNHGAGISVRKQRYNRYSRHNRQTAMAQQRSWRRSSRPTPRRFGRASARAATTARRWRRCGRGARPAPARRAGTAC